MSDRYFVAASVENIGRVDGTTRDTWGANATVTRSAPGGPTTGEGRAKKPEVAIRRAVDDAFAKQGRKS